MLMPTSTLVSYSFLFSLCFATTVPADLAEKLDVRSAGDVDIKAETEVTAVAKEREEQKLTE